MYDIIIIGGGIAGLYLARELQYNALIIEAERVGGRIYTYQNKYMTVEAGAGRFHEGQPLINKLVKELKLKTHRITSSASFSPADYTNSLKNSILDIPSSMPLISAVMDIGLGVENLPIAGYIAEIIAASQFESKHKLQSMTFINYAKEILDVKEIKRIKDEMGYYSELAVANAYDCIYNLQNLNPNNKYYGVVGGLSQIVDRMPAHVVKGTVTSIKKKEFFEIDCIKNGKLKKYYSKICVCAIPYHALRKFPIFKPMKIKEEPLCRIYCQFDELWYKDLPKMTTNNNLRMIIPLGDTIMISYTDNKYAVFWKELYDKEGISGVNAELVKLIFQSTGIHIPTPKHTKVFYWEYGVAYWGINADSKPNLEPRPNLYICGENYSEHNQQWMEGALETSLQVANMIKLKQKTR